MNKINTGGPAFPLEKAKAADGSDYYPGEHQGMTLRDYFAAKAMPIAWHASLDADIEFVANQAYQIADAMLKARE